MKLVYAIMVFMALSSFAAAQDYVPVTDFNDFANDSNNNFGAIQDKIVEMDGRLKTVETATPATVSATSTDGVTISNSSNVNLIVSSDNKQPVNVEDSKNVNGKVGENATSSLNMNNGNYDAFGTAGINMNNGDNDGFASPITSTSLTAAPLESTTDYNVTAVNTLNEDMIVEGNTMNRWEYNVLMNNQGVTNLPLWPSYVAIRDYEKTNNVILLDGPLTLVQA